LILTGCIEYSDGERTGTVTKLSRKGLICKSWEGGIYMGGIKKHVDYVSYGSGKNERTTAVTSMVANTFQFTIEDASLIPKVRRGNGIRRENNAALPTGTLRSMSFG
jgi:hypothetical protein